MSNAPIPKFVRKPSFSGSWLYNARLRELASQALVLVLLAWGLYEIVSNTQANLKHLNQNFGFDFLSQAANFDILSSIISYSSSSTFGRALLVGFWNTLLVAACGIVLATLIGFIGGIMRLSKNAVVSGAAALYVDIVRSLRCYELQCHDDKELIIVHSTQPSTDIINALEKVPGSYSIVLCDESVADMRNSGIKSGF